MNQTFNTNTVSPDIYSTISAIFSTFWLIFVIFLILQIVATWKIYSKAGKPGWTSLIPIYSTIVLFQICKLSPWLILLIFIPFVNIVAALVLTIIMDIKLAKLFGRSDAFAAGLIFLPSIFYLILGFSTSTYQG